MARHKDVRKQRGSLQLPKLLVIVASVLRQYKASGGFDIAILASVPILMAAGLLLSTKVGAQTRIASTALPTLPTREYGTANNYAWTGNTLAIQQTAPTSIVNWKSFDIGSAAKVTISQPSSTSVLLNKVSGGEILNRTTIDGVLNANGRVYIYNPNGIVFGKSGVVNVNTLVASTLKFDESRVIGGFLQPGALPILGADSALATIPGSVIVEGEAGSRAALNAANGGLILLAAPNVINNGVLSAPDGQVILAAGSKVYLAAPKVSETGTSLRGLLVEVSNDYASGASDAATIVGKSLAENGKDGEINVARGNATMIGYAVNQKGRVSASTSVSLNGSIYLSARDQAVRPDANNPFKASRSGDLLLGEGSVTQILPVLDDATTIPAATTFNKSEVMLSGANIVLEAKAKVMAPGGNVSLKAERLQNPSNPDYSVIDPKTAPYRVDMAAGSSIDVAGSVSVPDTLDANGKVVKVGTQLAMESNVITVDLRGTELADNVVLKNSPLYGSKVQIDIRKGTSAANVAGYVNLVEQGITQLNSAGGTVSIAADGAIIQRAGNTINVDGGYVDVKSGYVNTSKFQFNDKLVDIGSAVANVAYTGVVNVANSAANFEPGYRQGSSAGTVKFSAPIVVMQGALSGNATAGINQRDVSAVNYPRGGQLQIGNVSSEYMDPVSGKAKTALADQFGFAGKLAIGATDAAVAPAVGAPFDVSNADQKFLASRLDLDTKALSAAGFNRYAALTSGDIEVDASVNLTAGGKLWLGAGQATLAGADGSVAPGGNIVFKAPVTIPGGSLAATASGNLKVTDGIALDVAGRWQNDRALDMTALNSVDAVPVALNGGSVGLVANVVELGERSSVDVSAGAWRNVNGSTSLGKAGSITLQAAPVDPLAPSTAALKLGKDLSLSGYGFSSGGKLKLVGRNVVIGAASAEDDPADLLLSPTFFQRGGFTNYDIGGNLNFSLLANTSVTPQASSWQLTPNAGQSASGQMRAVAAPFLYTLASTSTTRPTTNVTFRALAESGTKAGQLLIDTGAQLIADPGASVSLLAGNQLTDLGTINAPAGNILFGLTPSAGSAPFDPSRSIWFGPKAKVLATGSTQRMNISSDGIATGELLDGGSIRIGTLQNNVLTPATGYVVAQSGASFSVSGVGAGTLSLKSAAGIAPAQAIASNGGSIEILAREGLLFEGSLSGSSGGSNALAGSLTVALDNDNGSPGGYPGDDRLLTIKSTATGIVPKGLAPGQEIVKDVFGTGKNKDVELGWFLTGSSSAGANAIHAGEGFLGLHSFAAGGFGRITLKSQGAMTFGLGTADMTLSARDALIIDTPAIRADKNTAGTQDLAVAGKTLTLQAPYVQLGNADLRYQAGATATTGNAALNVAATTLDLIGNTALQGFGTANLAAKSDIRLVGLGGTTDEGASTGTAPGALAMVGNLTLSDAQTYPTTLSDFTISVAPNQNLASGKLVFAANGNAAEPVLSAGGSVNAYAADILQGGRVVAPFGAIRMGNLDTRVSPIITNKLSYLNNSVTSVAGTTAIPFGNIVNGSVATASSWTYSLTDGTLISVKPNPTTGTSVPERAIPKKSIASAAQAILENSGAVIDLSGGGSLFAYEFTAGKGGSRDVLANDKPGTKTTVFAINPNFHGSVAPIDGVYGSDGGLLPGDSVTLSAMQGLPAGTYTLLPAHYALLQGGFSISLAPNTSNMQAAANTKLTDGSMLVAGRLSQSGSGTSSTRSNGFIVSSNAVVNTKSEITLTDATTYFKAKSTTAGIEAPQLPVDGGNVSFQSGGASETAMVLDGAIRIGAATTGRAGEADFTAPAITVLADRSQSTTNSVRLLADQLSGLGASSLVIGAVRDATGDSQLLNKVAGKVTLANNSLHPLSGSDIVLAASDTLKLAADADLRGAGSSSAVAQDILLDAKTAMLRVSNSAPIAVERSTTPVKAGSIIIDSGANVSASGSAYLDAPGGANVNGKLNFASGSAWGFAAPLISFGSGIPALTGGLKFDTEALTALSGLSQLSFNSYGSVLKMYGTVNLGNSSSATKLAMRDLSFKVAGFQGLDSTPLAADRSVNFAADTVRLDGSATSLSAAPSATSLGQFNVQARQIEIGDAALAVRDFANVALVANSQLLATGTAGQFTADNKLTVAAGRMTSNSGAAASIAAGSDLILTQVANPSTPVQAAGLGGQLRFAAASISSDAQIQVPSGQVALLSAGLLDVKGGKISTAGSAVQFGSTTAFAPAGQISLSGASVQLGEAAVLDVSARGAAAGKLAITAAGIAGSVTLDGTLLGAAEQGTDGLTPVQGQFSLQADAAGSGFGALNAKLNTAGFTESRQFGFRNGDVTLAGTDTIKAHALTISADNGNITIAGDASIDATGTKGGSIALYATQTLSTGNAGRVVVDGNARLLANSTAKVDPTQSEAGSIGNGGRVVISAGNADGTAATLDGTGARISLDGGSIDVGGNTAARDGSVTLSASRLIRNSVSDVAIDKVNTRISNSARTIIEANKVYVATTVSETADSESNLNAGVSGRMYLDAQAFTFKLAPLYKRLDSLPNVVVRAGLDLRSPEGDLSVSVNEFAANAADRGWNLGAWRFNGAPVALSLRAKGDLRILGSISDGFVKPVNALLSMPDWALGTDDSASFRLVAGANFKSADPLAVIAGTGDFKLGFAARTPTSLAPLAVNDAPVALVRSGTGTIDVSAGRDISLAMAGFFTNADGTPAIYDKLNYDSTYQVSLFGANIYTAGKKDELPDVSAFVAPKNVLNVHFGSDGKTLSDGVFASGGGAITLAAGRNIAGPVHLGANGKLDPNWFYRNNDGVDAIPEDTETKPVTPAEPAIPGTPVALPAVLPQLVNDWLFRQGRSYVDANGVTKFETTSAKDRLNTAWWSRFDYFDQGVATLGGGDLRITAGGNIANLAASVATNAYVAGPVAGALSEKGGGDLLVRAGGNIAGGNFYVQKGLATLRADGSIGAGNNAPLESAEAKPLNPVLAVGDARFDVSAGNQLTIETAYNPTMTEQSINNVVAGNARFNPIYGVGSGARWDVTDTSQDSLDYRLKYAQFSNFSTYGANSAVNLMAIGGNLALSNDAANVSVAGVSLIPNALGTSFPNLYVLAPPTMRAAALTGDISSANGFTMMPSATGQLDLLAAGSIKLNTGATGAIRMLDNDPAAMSSATVPRLFTATDFGVLDGSSNGIAAHELGGLHTDDKQPVRLVANTGDIIGDGLKRTTISLPKQAQISAGRDIIDLGMSIQQNNPADVSSIVAGRDFIDITQSRGIGAEASPVANVISGPGRVDVSGGRNVDFGNGSGLVTRGNLDNPFLPAGGASINIVAGGVKPVYAAFVAYANNVGSASAVLPGELPDLIAFLRQRLPSFAETASVFDAWIALRALPQDAQAQFLSAYPAIAARLVVSATELSTALAAMDKPMMNERYFAMMVEDSRVKDLSSFDRLISSLNPRNTTTAAGDIALYNSQVKTEQGGSIDLFAPTGSVFAGLTTGVAANQASKQGIFTIRGGAVRSLVKTDFLVNQGRVFTLGGGDITLVSQYANIDAGRGAKTASSAPPPLITIDANGNIKVDVSGSISGSGIATLKTRSDQPDSNVYPIAPRGIFDAGDAGVRSTGKVDIVANVVLNGANISAGGAISGAPASVAPPAPASSAAPASAASATSDVAKTLASTEAATVSNTVAVDVVGYGDGKAAEPVAETAAEEPDDKKTSVSKSPKNKQQPPK